LRLSEKLIEIGVFSGVMTMWVLVFNQMWEAWLQTSGYSIGIGEIYLGFMFPAVVASLASWFLIKRIRAKTS